MVGRFDLYSLTIGAISGPIGAELKRFSLARYVPPVSPGAINRLFVSEKLQVV